MELNIIEDENAGTVGSALIKVVSLFFIGVMIIAFTANPISVGTNQGQRAPDVEGKFYNGTGWLEFDFESYFNYSWQEGDINGQWVAIEFMDTDCPYCVKSAKEYGEYADYFNAYNPNSNWDGAHVNFLASATELSIQGHDSSRNEIEAFRDKTGGEDCAGADCSSRGGPVHNFPYIDDLDQDNMAEWGIPGTPNYFLIQPDGIIAWSSSENTNEEISDAILRLVPRAGA